MKDKKRDYNLKSPGIKPRHSMPPNRNHPPSHIETRFPYLRNDEEQEPLLLSQGTTPPTPSTPRTPPPHTSDNSVFANIFISGQQQSKFDSFVLMVYKSARDIL